MLAVYVVEHFGHLPLRQAFAVQAAGKAFALVLLLAEDCQYAGVEVAVPVTGDTEVQGTTVTVCTARTEAVALVAAKAFFIKVFLALRQHKTLQHHLHQVL